MDAREKAEWRAAYRERMEAIERVWVQELSELTEEDALRRMWSLGKVENPWRDRPDWSGLVEQQAILHRRKKS